MNMEMSEKDKQLLYIVAALLIVAASYFFGYRNFANKTSEYKAQTQVYLDEYSRLFELQKNREQYTKMTTEYENQRAEILTAYKEGFSRQNLIMMLADIEDEKELWISEMQFVEEEVLYNFASEAGTCGVVNTTKMSFEAGYVEFKAFIDALLTMDSKTTIDTLNVTYDEELSLLDGEIVLSHYTIVTPTTVAPTVDIDLPVGVDNIFDSTAVVSGASTDGVNADYILTDYDACVVVNANDSTFDSIIVGTTNDSDAKDSLSVDENSTQELTMTVTGSDGKYTISYKLGDKTYPAKNYEKGANLKPGSTLDLLVLSSVRSGNKDKVAVKVNLINESDMKLNVLVSGDDTTSPRVSFDKREGDIEIYR